MLFKFIPVSVFNELFSGLLMHNRKIIFLILNQKICCGYSKEDLVPLLEMVDDAFLSN